MSHLPMQMERLYLSRCDIIQESNGMYMQYNLLSFLKKNLDLIFFELVKFILVTHFKSRFNLTGYIIFLLYILQRMAMS